jgi:hypothetical protein
LYEFLNIGNGMQKERTWIYSQSAVVIFADLKLEIIGFKKKGGVLHGWLAIAALDKNVLGWFGL